MTADLHEVYIEGSDGPVVLPEPIGRDTLSGDRVCATEGCDGGREVAVDCPNGQCYRGCVPCLCQRCDGEHEVVCRTCQGLSYIAGTCYLEHGGSVAR